MKRQIIAFLVILLIFGCKKREENKVLDSYFVAEIVDFDRNCSTCVLKFPNDSLTIKHEIGSSENNFYNTTNLTIDNFTVGQRISVLIRKPSDNEEPFCMTLYATYTYRRVFIVDYKFNE